VHAELVERRKKPVGHGAGGLSFGAAAQPAVRSAASFNVRRARDFKHSLDAVERREPREPFGQEEVAGGFDKFLKVRAVRPNEPNLWAVLRERLHQDDSEIAGRFLRSHKTILDWGVAASAAAGWTPR